MSQKSESFTKQIVAAVVANNRSAANTLTQQALQSIGQELVQVIEGYPTADLPLVIASMRIIASAFEGVLPESGKLMASHLANMTESIIINKGDLLRQLDIKEDP